VVVHVVLFRPRAGLSDDSRRQMFDALKVAATTIPTVQRFSVGQRTTHGAAYEKLMREDFPFAAIIEFADLAGLQAYLRHPQHEKLGALFYQLQESALAYDYEITALT
jgi:Stress responsive A/B Barrel Domain